VDHSEVVDTILARVLKRFSKPSRSG